MTAAALALTAAVLMHVAWNLLARASHPDSRFLWWALVGYLVVLGLPQALEEAVQMGIALYFNIEFELFRKRWYWFDRKVASQALVYRLSYSPLTRQYRLARGGLSQPFESLEEALALVKSVRNWKVADRAQLAPRDDFDAQVRMRLDVSQLPKPFQVNALASRDWHLASEPHRISFVP